MIMGSDGDGSSRSDCWLMFLLFDRFYFVLIVLLRYYYSMDSLVLYKLSLIFLMVSKKIYKL